MLWLTIIPGRNTFFSIVKNQVQGEVSRFNCLSRMFSQNLLRNWTVVDPTARDLMGAGPIRLTFEDSKGS